LLTIFRTGAWHAGGGETTASNAIIIGELINKKKRLQKKL
jgi:hypothetical protein